MIRLETAEPEPHSVIQIIAVRGPAYKKIFSKFVKSSEDSTSFFNTVVVIFYL